MSDEMKMPKDPFMLLSFLNLKLRDYYKDLDTLCEELRIDPEQIKKQMKEIDYEYDENTNQFI